VTLELAAADAALLQAAAAADRVPLPEWIARTALFVAERTSQPVATPPAAPVGPAPAGDTGAAPAGTTPPAQAGTTPAEEPLPDARVANDWSAGRRRPNF